MSVYLIEEQVAKYYMFFKSTSELIEKSIEFGNQSIENEWLFFPLFFSDSEKEKVVILIPTMCSRFNTDRFLETLVSLMNQVKSIKLKYPDVGFEILIGIQHKEHEKINVKNRAFNILNNGNCQYVYFFIMSGFGKVHSINHALSYSQRTGANCFGVFDDDIVYDKCCLEKLWMTYKSNYFKTVVGIKCDVISKSCHSTSLFSRLREYAAITVPYPSGAYLINPNELKEGIPVHYHSDDGYIFFKMIDCDAENPFHKLSIEPNARGIHVEQVSTNRRKKLRRMMINTHLLLSGFNRCTNEIYKREIIFDGFWPIGKLCLNKGTRFAMMKWFSKSLLFILYISIKIELYVRGAINKPLKRIEWGS